MDTNRDRDREMVERIMALVGEGSFDGEQLEISNAFTAEFVVAGLAVVASEVRAAADRIIGS